MVKKIVQVPIKIIKGTAKAASWAYKLASGALLGAAIYKGIQKAREARGVPGELPPIPEPPLKAPKPRVKRKKRKKAAKKQAVKRKPKKKAKKRIAKKKPAKKRKAKKK